MHLIHTSHRNTAFIMDKKRGSGTKIMRSRLDSLKCCVCDISSVVVASGNHFCPLASVFEIKQIGFFPNRFGGLSCLKMQR